MANDDELEEGEEEGVTGVVPNGKPPREYKAHDDGTGTEEEEDEDEEDEEPLLKYATLTKNLGAVYRNGDAASVFMVAGDKMVVGTHNGYIHVYSVPQLEPIRVFPAHKASISALSISPCPPPFPSQSTEPLKTTKQEAKHTSASSATSSPKSPPKKPQAPPVPNTPSNSIHIASASIDGNVFVASLIDQKDVQLRNFGRPVQAIGLSPQFKSDRSYLSGGRAGSLILTTGGQLGAKSNANVSGANTTGWLGSIGLSSSAGKDEVLHSGEGAISTIKWSLSGKYVAWVNEKGIKLMRSNLSLEHGQSEQAWKRISHIDHPNRPGWDEMAGIWKAHLEWIDEAGLEGDDFFDEHTTKDPTNGSADLDRLKKLQQSRSLEKLIIGWAGTIWVVNVKPNAQEKDKPAKVLKPAKAEIVTILRMDCIISGLSLYTPNLLIVLAFLTPEENLTSNPAQARKGFSRRQNAPKPEIRIIDINSKEEVSIADTLDVSRYENLSATDYHLGTLPAIRVLQKASSQRGTLEVIGGGIEAIGGGLWDATMYPAKLLTTATGFRVSGSPSSSKAPSLLHTRTESKQTLSNTEVTSMQVVRGMQVFIQSPYDCLVATKPTFTDHYTWLATHAKYEEAWYFLERHPDAVPDRVDTGPDSTPSTPTRASLMDVPTEDGSVAVSTARRAATRLDKERLRVGERWIDQLVSNEEWSKAGRVCGQILGSSDSWEHWVNVFASANRFDELTPFVPGDEAHPNLPPAVYETLLIHYISIDRLRFSKLVEKWPPELFNVDILLEAIQSKFKSGEVREDSVEDGVAGRDWRLLMESLARLFLAVGRPRKALRCFVQLQDADAAMSLIADAHLVEAVADDIPGFVLLRVSKEQQRSAPLAELASLTLDPIRLLVSEAHHGTVMPETVVKQLQNRYGMPNPYLYFYFRALWHGETAPTQETKSDKRALPVSERLLANEGKNLVSDFADTAVALFAEYDRELLMTFLKSSQSYTLSYASQICEQRNFTPELVYLLSKEGRTGQALRLIIDQLGDVSQAISFAKEQNDASLWDDLLELSMSKPSFIRGLLEEVGTSIDPLKLVKRIPLGLEIEGLREGLGGMLKEFEVQESISKGVARVLRSEVNANMQQRSQGLRKGIMFEVAKGKHRKAPERKAALGQVKAKDIRAGHCAACGDPMNDQDHPPGYLLSFPCGHVFHLSCLLGQVFPPGTTLPTMLKQFAEPVAAEDEEWEIPPIDRSIGPKIDRVRLLGTVLQDGCPLESKEGDG